MNETYIDYIDADEAWKQRIAQEWGETAARHMHLAGGFSILALHDRKVVGLISVYWRALPAPLSDACEGYIDIVEVLAGFRRRGIATKLIEMSAERAQARGVHQLRAWSSEDKAEAIPMWQALGFGLCPATTYPKGQKVDGYFVTRVL
jgi:GNAT superfamily N-acetyltransferase